MRDEVREHGSRGGAECVWMQAGVVSYKLCDRRFDCERCPFDMAIRDADRLQQLIDSFLSNPASRPTDEAGIGR
jgi:hypothetical protein